MKRSIPVIIVTFIIFMPVGLTGQKSGHVSEKKVTVSGIITGQDGKPVSGAQIYVDSVNTGTLTNGLGKYKIKVNPGAKKLIAGSADHGYGVADINFSRPVNITLNGDTKNLAAFIARNTSEKAQGRANKSLKINAYNDIYQMIRQEVPGVVVSGKSIVVQQQNSFLGSSQPLFVVNGVRVTSIDYINPLEVKSIQLLKGSNANIYGIEGANGVISIILKSGADK